MQTVTVTIPTWVNPFGASAETWLLIVSVCGAALLASIIVEVIKRKYNANQQEALAKHYTALLLAAFTSLFTAVSYFLSFAQSNAAILNVVPFLGRHVPQAIGAAYVFYNLRLNKTYQTVAQFLGKWSKSGVTTPTAGTVSVTPEATIAPSDSLLS